MSQSNRTAIFIALACVSLAMAWWARPATIQRDALDDSGERFFDQFDPLAAKSLEIVRINADTAAMQAFKVEQRDGRWSIPSREHYPADAQDRLAQAATSVMDLVKGPSVSDSPADHELYGVVDPTTPGVSASGAGTRVTLKDEAGKTLVDLIIGKSVKEADQLRYVRIPGRDRVYTAKVDPSQLSTKFQDWIERDLLKLDPMHLSEIVIDDYSIDEINQRLIRGDRLTLRYERTGYTWTLDGLGEGESLQPEKLNTMSAALDDLEIVDVHRKPAGLSSELQGQDVMQLDNEAVMSLMSRGYYIVGGQLLSNEGELIVRTTQGVEYTLRFGEVVNYEKGTDTLGEEDESDSGEAGRYVFVTATFKESLIEQPQYEPVPEPAEPSEEDGEASAEEDPARAAVIAANEEKRKAYEKKIADGKELVKSLNARFADWYYVVSDSTYQKLRLRRQDIVLITQENDSAQTPQTDDAAAPPAVEQASSPNVESDAETSP